MINVGIVGAGGHAAVVADILQAMARAGADITVKGFVDDDRSKIGTRILDVPVMGAISDLATLQFDALVIAVGNNAARARLAETFARQSRRFISPIHPSATVSSSAQLNDGVMVAAAVVVNPLTIVGAHTILNTSCSVDHHNVLGTAVHIAPGARLGGNVWIGPSTLVGIGAVVMPGRRVGAGSTVGAGAVVTTDIADGQTVIGIPARIVSHSRE